MLKVNVKRKYWTHLAQKNSRPRARINTIFRLSRKYFNRISITIKTFLRYLVCFAFRVLLFKNNSVEKNMNLQQALFFSLLKKTKLIKEKKTLPLVFNNGVNKNEAINILGSKPILISL